MLGIPIPNLFMATNPDNTWEVVDGLQRLSAIAKFAGTDELRKRLNLRSALVLQGLKKTDKFNGLTFEGLPPAIQQHLRTRPLKVVTLNDKSDKIVRFDLFERLNTGGIILTKQEIRSCVYQGDFADKLDELSKLKDFRTVARLTEKQRADGTAEECVLRFFAFADKYKVFEHSVEEFLNDYMKSASTDFNMATREKEFRDVFGQLANIFPHGIMRPQRKGNTSLILFEGVTVGATFAIRKKGRLESRGLSAWMGSPKLRAYTTGATNSTRAVKGRIEFCRDRFLGIPYVPAAAD